MAGYFEEMGWRELQDGETPDYLLQMARFLIDSGVFDEDISGDWPRLPPPASKEAVESLDEVEVEDDSTSCPICLKNYSAGEKLKKLPCNHLFHSPCILTWLAKTNSCPFCRHELPTGNEFYEAFKKEKLRAEQRQDDIDTLHNSMFG